MSGTKIEYDPPYAAAIKREGTYVVPADMWQSLIMYLADVKCLLTANNIEEPHLPISIRKQRDGYMMRQLKREE